MSRPGTRTNLAYLVLILAAFFFWYLVFVFPPGNFWIKLSSAAAVLAVISLFFRQRRKEGLFSFHWKDLLIGAASAVILYFIFFLGKLALAAVRPDSGGEIQSVYHRGEAVSPIVIGILLLLVTSPAEEIFWRGFIQRRTVEKLGPVWGLIITTILYGAVHIWTFNITLIIAALVAGLFWGLMYLKLQRLLPVIVSHALWTFSIFVLFPMG